MADARAQALVDERMPEPETPAATGGRDQASGDRRLKTQQQMFGIDAGHVFEQLRLEFAAGDGGDREQRLGVVGKPAGPAQQHVADAAGNVV
jgi:hypothetical protein